eukprot:9968750-Heterocapsa_arctica.AAC.1
MPAHASGMGPEEGAGGTFEEGHEEQTGSIDRAVAQAMQDEEDTDATAAEWISFFQEPAESQ